MNMATEQKLVDPGALDKLAKLLAAENIMVEHRPIKTAYFDVKNRVLALPMWKQMTETLYHMLVLHEVGHALETPAAGWKGALDKIEEQEESKFVAQTFQGYLNVVEDARIERKIKNKFPGSRRDFLEGYDWLHEQDFFAVKSRKVDDLSLVDRINLYFKLGARIRIKFNEEEMVFVKRAEQTLTFDDVVKLAEDLLAYAKLKKEENDEDEFSMKLEYEDGDGEYSDDFDDLEEDDSGSEGDSSSALDKNNEENDSSPSGGSGKSGSSSYKNLEQATTDQSMNDRMEELLDPVLANRKFTYITFPKDVTHEEFTVDYRTLLAAIESDFAKAFGSAELIQYRNKLLNKFRSENNSAINYMVKEFERKKAAVAYARTKQSKTGVIDTNKIHSYKFNDDIFKRLNIEPNGKNHGVVAILDMSGSMSSSYRGAMDQLISLAMFCRRVGIPHRIYGFTQCALAKFAPIDPNRQLKKRAKLTAIDTRLGMNKPFVFPDMGFDLIELFHEKMSLRDFNTMIGTLLVSSAMMSNDEEDYIDGRPARHWIDTKFGSSNYWNTALSYLGLGGTPLNDAILVSRDLMAKFRKEKNIQIMNFVCITDGESNHSDYYRRTHPAGSLQKTFLPESNSRETMILIDEESRVQTTMNFDYGHEKTAMFARMVRHSQNATFVGFYIVSSAYDVRHVSYRYMNTSQGLDFQEKWKKNKNAVVPNMLNFDEFYIIYGGKNLRTQQATIGDNVLTKGQLARAFISAQNKRGASRGILSRFIEKIAA